MHRFFGMLLGLALASPLAAIASPPALSLTVAKAAVVKDEATGAQRLDVELADASRDAFANFTESHVGKRVSFRANGKTLTTVTVQSPITEGKLTIDPGQGRYGLTPAELEKLAQRLGSGKEPIEVVEKAAD